MLLWCNRSFIRNPQKQNQLFQIILLSIQIISSHLFYIMSTKLQMCVKFFATLLSESRIFRMARRVCGITEGAEYAEDTEKSAAIKRLAYIIPFQKNKMPFVKMF